jgi:hypothetical protein
MRNTVIALLSVLALLTTVSASALPGTDALLAPVKCAAGDVTPDGRVFPEPSLSATFLSVADFTCGVELLEEQHEGLIEVTTLGESRGRLPVYDIVVTDESVPVEDKRHMLILSSIHGNEHAGREGGARVIEDMVGQRNDQEFIAQTLQQFVVHFVFPNPDGWGNGDPTSAGGGVNFTRANDGARDLNRNFPVIGYLRSSNGTLDQSEARGLDALLRAHADTAHETDDPAYRGWYLGTDNHGQGVKPVAASGLQIVGQFDYGKSELLAQFADSISDNIEGVALESIEALNQATGGAVQPYEWGTLYDILGYSAAGSGIDYYNSPGIVEGTGFATEMTASNLPFSNIATHPGLVNQMWVDTVRAINYAMFKTAVAPAEFTFPVPGRAAYVLDEATTSSRDTNGFGPSFGTGYAAAVAAGSVPTNFTGAAAVQNFEFAHYDVSRMRFFADLNAFTDNDLTAVTVAGVLDGSVDLSAYDSLVLADRAMPAPGDRTAWVAALDAFVEGGGDLIVTDGAAPIIAEMAEGIAPADITRVTRNVGYVDFVGEGPLNSDLRGVASQTYDVVPIGYPDNANAAPNWRVARAAWEAAGGTTAGTNGTGQTVYGQLPQGAGNILFLGALLPEPTEAHFHPYGLQNYAVTYTGYTLLANMLGLAAG